MEIFHYCAEQLKDRDLFVSCTDKALKSQKKRKSGAIFNDFENDPFDLMLHNDTNESVVTSPTQVFVSQDEVDGLFIQADEDDPLRYSIDHELFSTDDIISLDYRQKVFAIVEKWDDMPIYNDHIQR